MAQHIKNKRVVYNLSGGLRGFTLMELMIATAVMTFAFTGIMNMLFSSIATGKMDRDSNKAYNAVRAKMEEIKNTAFTNLDDYNDNPEFDLDGFAPGDAKGRIEVSGSANSRQVRIIASYKAGQRIIGEAVIDAYGDFVFYDKDGNGQFDSPVELVTLISNG